MRKIADTKARTLHFRRINRMKLFSKENMHDYLHTLFFMALGCAVYSISLNVFYNPIKLLGGGVTGLAQILHFELGVDISTMIICCNIPLFILALILVDRQFMIFSLIGMFMLSFFIKLFSGLSLPFESDLTAIALGGIINGMGLGLIYRSGASTGGSDIISKIIQKYYSGNMAYTGLIINVFIVGASAFIYGLDQTVLTLCAMFISSQVNTYVIDGVDHRRAISIITTHPNEMAHAIYQGVNRGATVLKGYGSYTHEEHDMLYCVISKRQLAKVKRIIKATDPDAFFTITMVTGVYGFGKDFFSIQKNIK